MGKLDFPGMLFSRNCFRWKNRTFGEKMVDFFIVLFGENYSFLFINYS